MLVNNTNDVLILLLSISVCVSCISHIPKPKCREKEFLQFFPKSDYWNRKFPGSEIPGLLYLTEKWLRKYQEVVLTQTGNSARKFHWLGISESPSEIWLSQDVKVVLTSTGNSARKFHWLGISESPSENWLSQDVKVVLISTGNSTRIFRVTRNFRVSLIPEFPGPRSSQWPDFERGYKYPLTHSRTVSSQIFSLLPFLKA